VLEADPDLVRRAQVCGTRASLRGTGRFGCFLCATQLPTRSPLHIPVVRSVICPGSQSMLTLTANPWHRRYNTLKSEQTGRNSSTKQFISRSEGAPSLSPTAASTQTHLTRTPKVRRASPHAHHTHPASLTHPPHTPSTLTMQASGVPFEPVWVDPVTGGWAAPSFDFRNKRAPWQQCECQRGPGWAQDIPPCNPCPGCAQRTSDLPPPPCPVPSRCPLPPPRTPPPLQTLTRRTRVVVT
jgi:hypothetical protein